MGQTRPIGEQILIHSSATGDHSLDDYIEDSEIGGKTVPELLASIFDANDGVFKAIEHRGAWANATVYAVGDVVRSGNAYYMCSVAHTSSGSINLSNFVELWDFSSSVNAAASSASSAAASLVAVQAITGDIPAITAGDAGRGLKVNAGGTGYDLTTGLLPTAADLSKIKVTTNDTTGKFLQSAFTTQISGALSLSLGVINPSGNEQLQITGSVSLASDSVSGAVELATVAETQAGTDTARATTPAGVKAVANSGRSILISTAVG